MNKADRIKVEKWIKENIGMDSHEIREFRGVRLADLLQLYADEQSGEEAIDFLDSIRDYIRESNNNLAHDERESAELYNVYKSKEGE